MSHCVRKDRAEPGDGSWELRTTQLLRNCLFLEESEQGSFPPSGKGYTLSKQEIEPARMTQRAQPLTPASDMIEVSKEHYLSASVN